MNNIDTSVAAEACKLKMTIKSLEIVMPLRAEQKQYDSLMTCLKESYHQGQPCWGSYKMVVSQRPGPVDYSAIPQLSGVVLEPYRKDPIQVYKLEYTGE
jgi:hypothetical protein